MDAEQAYLFDLNGYIVLQSAVAPDAVATLLRCANERQRPSDDHWDKAQHGRRWDPSQHALHWDKAFRDLVDHPRISPILAQLCGSAFRLDHVNVHARPSNPAGEVDQQS